MSTLNSDQSQSVMEEIIDSGLTAAIKPNSKKQVLSKGDARYWLEGGRLFKNHDAAEYACRFTALGRRGHFKLGTANKKTAAAKAAAVYCTIQSKGWEVALAQFKPTKSEQSRGTTVGAFIETACRISTARSQSLEAYTKAFRKIVSEISGLSGDRKHDVRGGGAAVWRKKIDAVELASIAPAEIMAWKKRRLLEAGDDPLEKRRTIVTVNSLIRNAKALFGKKRDNRVLSG
jgi:hypothetical protein